MALPPTAIHGPSRPVVGVLGIGAMGGAMAARLVELGWSVIGHDLRADRRGVLAAAGGRVARDAADLAQHCDVLVVAVVDARQVRAALWGEPGDGVNVTTAIAGAFGGGAVPRVRAVLLCPTIAPDDTVAFAERLAAAGILAIDAPMSGGPARARDGTMSLMVAGPAPAVAAVQPLLDALSNRIVPLGQRVGDGARVKLVNNLLAGVHLAAAAEALALAERVGLDPATVLEVVERSSGQSWIGGDRMRRRLACTDGPVPVMAQMTLLAKDTALAARMAASAGVSMPLGERATAAFAAACAAGWADADDAHLIDWQAGVRRPA
jgi:L-threonate 2-dehydrogenase